jgi:hypothetical protein
MSSTPTQAPPSPVSVNNLATYAGALIAGGVFYWMGRNGIFAPAGSEATAAGIFAAIIGHVAGRLTGGK